jgi:hypothetical protein
VTELGRDLESGKWGSEYGHLQTQAQFEGSLKLIIGRN